MRLTQEYSADIEHRYKYATMCAILLLLIVGSRLFYLQIIRGRSYQNFSAENSIKTVKIPAMRGSMFDRRGQMLVESRHSFAVVVTPQYVADPQKTLDSLAKILKMPRENLDQIWTKRHRQGSYQPIVVESDVSQDVAAFIRARKNPLNEEGDEYDLRGVDIEIQFERLYPDGNIATHALGYVKEIDSEKLKKYGDKYPGLYNSGDLIGIEGIEEQWDHIIRGADGFQEKIVNAVGREVNYEGISDQLEDRPVRAGNSLKLTLDKDLQKLARDLYGTKKGAIVAIDVKTGAIRLMYSSPSYDLNMLQGSEGSAYYNKISSDPARYLLNRTIQGGYPPGSTYKIVNAVASLSEGVIKPDDKLTCNGVLMYGGRAYHCSRRGGHGAISIHKAIVASCDIYFYLTGLRLGVDRLAKYANMFGLGNLTGVPLSGERPGLIPTSEWKLKRFGVPWQQGETLSISIGQGYDIETPIQNAMIAAQVANGGKKLQLHLVEEAYDVDGKEIYTWNPPDNLETLPIDPEVMKIVKSGMVGVVAEAEGTGYRQSTRPVTMGGKTGTAQVVQLDSNAICRGDVCKDHAWFIAFSPAKEPEIAAAAIVEHGGFGASAAAPIVGEIMQRYYEIKAGER